MRKISLTILLSICVVILKAQISIGPKVNLGVGAFHSRNMQKYLDLENANNRDIVEWDASSKLGVNGGLGVFVDFAFNEKMSIWAEMTYNWFNSGYKLTYQKNDDLKNEKIENITSSAKISTGMLSIPILFKYSFKGQSGPYALVGFRTNFLSQPQITSTEVKTTMDYPKNQLKVENYAAISTIDQFNTTNFNFMIGGGYSLDFKGKDLYIDLRYNLPISKSYFYTTNGYYNSDDGSTKNNLFGWENATEANVFAPQYQLNDFRMGFLEVSLAYTLFKSGNK